MCTSRQRRRGTDVHQQVKEKRDRCAPVGKGGEGQICTSRPRRGGTDVHQQDKEERDRYAPVGQE
jgi:hypothetical protein